MSEDSILPGRNSSLTLMQSEPYIEPNEIGPKGQRDRQTYIYGKEVFFPILISFLFHFRLISRALTWSRLQFVYLRNTTISWSGLFMLRTKAPYLYFVLNFHQFLFCISVHFFENYFLLNEWRKKYAKFLASPFYADFCLFTIWRQSLYNIFRLYLAASFFVTWYFW